MKKIMFLTIYWGLFFLATGQPSYVHPDTIVGRCSRYYYQDWYDECPSYQHDSNFFRPIVGIPFSTDSVCNNVIVEEYYVPGRMRIRGLAALVPFHPEQTHPIAAMPRLSQDRARETLMLFQGGDYLSDVTPVFSPRQMELVDSVRWDTAAPYIMKLPLTASALQSDDTSLYMTCYVYEAYFSGREARMVDTFFYIGGTGRSNAMVCPTGVGQLYLTNYPTVYAGLRDENPLFCERCRDGHLLYRTPFPFDDKDPPGIMIHEGMYHCGYFLPIVDYFYLSVEAADPVTGNVSGGGRYPEGSVQEISAVPAEGYHFSHWDDGGTDNPRAVEVNQSMTFVAFFVAE